LTANRKEGKMKTITLMLLLLLLGSITLWSQEADRQFQAADQSLMLMPTAYTMPKGSSTFTDYEIFIVQYAYGVTGRTHLSIGMPFPIVADAFQYSALGIKQNYLKYQKLQGAFMVTWMPKVEGGALSNVFSYGNEKASVHGFVGVSFDYDKIQSGTLLALGGIVSTSKRVALMAEVISSSAILEEEANGLLNLGVRIKGDKMSWDLGGFRPLAGDTGTFLLFPLIKMTVLF
jgi:hypothetical protein